MLSQARLWFLAARPWSYSVSITPVVLGTLMAWLDGCPLRWDLFLMTLIAGVLLHSGCNYLNTYGDYLSGVDTVESAFSCPHLVRGMLTPRPVWRAGVLCLGAGAAIGVVLAVHCGWPVVCYGGLGLAGAYCYTTSPAPYKYVGLGPVLVFFLMGPLMVCPAYFVQAGSVPLSVVAVSLIIGCLVTGVLQANDIQDIKHDRASGIRTMAIMLGRRKAIMVYCSLYVAAFALLGLSIAARFVPPAALITLPLVVPMARMIRNLAHKPCREAQVSGLMFWSARYHTQFGVLFAGALIVAGLAR